MATKNPFVSDKELFDYSDKHLLHEIEMFRWLASELPGKEASNECSAFVESFALHLRNLIDFFYAEPFDDDVVAEYFYDDPSKWRRGTTPPVLRAAKKRADKEANHLTKARMNVTPTDKGWRTAELYVEIQKVAQKFEAEASRKKLGPKVIAFITAHFSGPTATILSASNAFTARSRRKKSGFTNTSRSLKPAIPSLAGSTSTTTSGLIKLSTTGRLPPLDRPSINLNP